MADLNEMKPNIDRDQIGRISRNLYNENILRSSVIEEDLRKTKFFFLLYARRPGLFLDFINDLMMGR